jgi:glycosyltransferase involved in cell wall biosynthesis
VRLLKRGFLATVARLSSRILTVSQHSKRCIERDLGVLPSRIRVVHIPADQEMAARVRALKEELPQRDVAIYVGRFAPHKNLDALIAAFQGTRFRQRGGRLLLVGGSPREVAELRGFMGRLEWAMVKGSCPQSELEEFFATSRLLVMPSLEEGFGLPVWEAMTCGLPVCVSDGGALPEISRSVSRPFPARSVSAMTAAIDDVAERPVGSVPRVQRPTLTEFAGAFVEEAEMVVRGRSSPGGERR